jgi:hypothetical protein
MDPIPTMPPQTPTPAPIPVLAPTPAPIRVSTPAPAVPTLMLCTYCHQPLLSTYYYCPNCGTKVSGGELSTSLFTQAWIYVFSAILPLMGFIMITKWPAIKYYRSVDPKAKNIGTIAFVIISISTLITIWLVYIEVQEAIQSTTSSINADLSGQGD